MHCMRKSESPVIPEVTGTPIENVEESVQENAEAETASQQETQTETTATGKVEITTEDFEGSSDPENAEREYTYTYQVPTITIEGNEEAQDKIQKDLNAYVETFWIVSTIVISVQFMRARCRE